MEIKLTLWYNKYKIQNLQWLYIYMYLNVCGYIWNLKSSQETINTNT